MAYEFNPIKEDKDGVIAHRAIWTTNVLTRALKGVEEGKKLVANPFYMKNTKLLKSDLVFERTPEEIDEYLKCMTDIIYFANNYCSLMTPTGVRRVTLRDYQIKYLRHLQKNRMSIYLAARQSGKTTTSAIFLLWYLLFETDKNALVVANKEDTAKEILDKTKEIFYEVPWFLKPGVVKWNEYEIVLDNKCRIMAKATTMNTGISFTLHCVLADEFAHLPKNIQRSFYQNLLPTISAANARFMITSTQNGHELFAEIFEAALRGENDYGPFETTWDQVPDFDPVTNTWVPRDEAWHRRQVGNLGGEIEFNAQFGTEFIVKSNTLISKTLMREQKHKKLRFVTIDHPLLQDFYFHPDFDLSQFKHGKYVVTIDISEGLGQDFTIFNINYVTYDVEKHGYKFTCVAYYKSQYASIDENINALANFCVVFFKTDNYLLSLEYNLYGELFYRELKRKLDELTYETTFDETLFARYKSPSSDKMLPGIKITSASKPKYCALYKQNYERGLIENQSEVYYIEMENFASADKSNRFSAVNGHDDMMMTSIQLEALRESASFHNFIDNDGVDSFGASPFETVDDSENIFAISARDVVPEMSIHSMQMPSARDEIYSRLARINQRRVE